jgi:flagellar hook protein FlgE
MTLSAVSNIGLSGMRAQAQRLAVAADNVANASTPGYVRKAVDLVAVESGEAGYGAGVAVRGLRELGPGGEGLVLSGAPTDAADGAVGPDADLAADLVSGIEALRAFEANAAIVRTGAEMTDALLRTLDDPGDIRR